MANERNVTLTEVRDLLEKAQTERGELTYEQKLALEHAKKFAKYDADGLKKVVAELQENPKVDAVMAVRLVDLSPTAADDVRALFAKSRANLSDPEVQKILETVAKYQTA